MSYLLKFKNRASSRPSRHRVKKDSKVNSPTVCTHYALESHLSANGGRRRRAELSNEVPQERRGSARGEQQAVPQGLDGFALAFARCDRSAQKKENKAPNKNGISPPCVEGGGKENLTQDSSPGFRVRLVDKQRGCLCSIFGGKPRRTHVSSEKLLLKIYTRISNNAQPANVQPGFDR